jgi:RHS repeat-associated protein
MPPSCFFIQVKKKAYIGISIIILGLLITGCSDHKTTVLSEQYKYDNKGRLISRITPDGRKTEYRYNKQGLLTKISYPQGSVSYGYDASGNRIWMENEHGRTEYKYDAFDRLTEAIFRYSPEKGIRYEYDPWSRISSIKILDRDKIDYQVKYEYNIIGNIVSIDDGAGRIEYSYYPERSGIVRHLPNGIKTAFSFSPIGQLTTLEHLDRHNRLIASYTYEYDSPGKISCVIEKTNKGIKTTRYEWDSRGYLNALNLPDGKTIRYEYDSMGNRAMERGPQGAIHYKYDDSGRLMRAENTKYEWNVNGNLISETGKEFNARIRYNGRGSPSLIRIADSTFRYQWDGDGNMISKRTGKDITHYLPNPLAPSGFTLAEFDKIGEIQNTYLYGETLLGQRDGNGQVQYFLEDGFNSIRCIADIKGNIIGKWDYSPFGEPLQKGGDISVNFRMAGERFLPEIKSYFISGRLYEPKIGRYLTPDSLPGHVKRFDSFNKYAHGCNAQGIFMEPRCNQTSKYRGWSYRVPEASKQILGGLQGVLEDTGTYGLPFNFTGIGELAELAGCQSGGQPVSWHELSKASEKTLGDFGTLTAHISRFIGRRLDSPHHVYQPAWWRGPDQGIKSWSPEDAEEFSRAGLRLLGSKWGIGGILDRFGKGVGNLARFYGTRMDRPYWWWSPMKWMPQEQYLQRSEEQGKRQATLAAKADRRKYKNDERKYYFKPPGGPPTSTGGPPGEDGGPDTRGPRPGGLLPPDSTGEGGQGCPIPDGFPLPFSTIENQLGGIKLSSSAEFIGNLSTIAGAVYDPQRQCLVLVGEENVALPSIKPEDLAVALACAFDPRYGDPQFSLDPADPRNPRGKWLKAVYMPEEVISGSPFGKSMFEADWLLKQYAFGVTIDKEGRKRERESSVPGFKSTVDLTFERPDSEERQEKWARFWIVSDEMKLREHGNSIYFDVAKMRVKAKKQKLDPSSPTGLRDVETDDPIASAFADQFSELYDEISKESPELARVKELAKAVALAKWIKKEGIPIDMGWVTEYVNKRIQTVERITALSEQWERRTEIPFTQGNRLGIRTIIRQLHLFGGVDLTVNPKFKPDNGQVESLQKEVVAALQRKETGPVFNVTHEGESLRAVVLPVTKSGQEMWKSSPAINKDGTTYQFNNEGIITKSTDKLGNISEYTYDADQKLKTIKIRAKNRWEAYGIKNRQGSLWTITNPRGNTIQYRYGHSGYLDIRKKFLMIIMAMSESMKSKG